METMIYMPLLGEGTDCWRSVRAVQSTEDIFEITDQIPAGESWMFGPNSRVRCRNHVFTNGETGLVAFEYAIENNPYYQLLKKHEREALRVTFSGEEELLIKVLHVDPQSEDFIYDLISMNSNDKGEAFVAKFADLVSAQLEN